MQTTTPKASGPPDAIHRIVWIDDDLEILRPGYPKPIVEALEEAGYETSNFVSVQAFLDAAEHLSLGDNPVFILDIRIELPTAVFKSVGITLTTDQFADAQCLREFLRRSYPHATFVFLSRWAEDARDRWGELEGSYLIDKRGGGESLVTLLTEELQIAPAREPGLTRMLVRLMRVLYSRRAVRTTTIRGYVEEIVDNYAYVRLDVAGEEHLRRFDLDYLKRCDVKQEGTPIVLEVSELRDKSVSSRIYVDGEAIRTAKVAASSEELRALSQKLVEMAQQRPESQLTKEE